MWDRVDWFLALMIALILTGCAAHEPRCDGTLQPINVDAAAPGSGALRHGHGLRGP